MARCCIFLLTALACSAALAESAPCETPPSHTIKILSLQMRDRGRGQARIDIPSNTTVQLVGTESGIDVMMEVRIYGESAPILADNPLRRRGPQRIVLEAHTQKRS